MHGLLVGSLPVPAAVNCRDPFPVRCLRMEALHHADGFPSLPLVTDQPSADLGLQHPQYSQEAGEQFA